MKLRGVLLVVLGVMAGRLTTDIKKVHAQQGCSLSTLNGAYAYRVDGNYFDNQGLNYQYSAVGRLVADGNGGFTGSETNSNLGTPRRSQTYTGTYTMNSDCTGSLVFKLSNAPTNYDIVVVPAKNEVYLIESESGITMTGTAALQNAAAPAPAQ
jgi:hypothetical protein